jgi:hypothetical protein
MAAMNFRRARTPHPNLYETYISNNAAIWPSRPRAFFVAIAFKPAADRLPLPCSHPRRAIHRQLEQRHPAGICSGLPRSQQRVPWRRDQTQLRGRSSVLHNHGWRFDVADRFPDPGVGRVDEVNCQAGRRGVERTKTNASQCGAGKLLCANASPTALVY